MHIKPVGDKVRGPRALQNGRCDTTNQAACFTLDAPCVTCLETLRRTGRRGRALWSLFHVAHASVARLPVCENRRKDGAEKLVKGQQRCHVCWRVR